MPRSEGTPGDADTTGGGSAAGAEGGASPSGGAVTAGIVCVDDNPLVSDALARRIAMEPDFRWLGALNEGDEIIERLSEMLPDVVLLDIDMPGIDAFDVVRQLARTLPTARVVMFTGYTRKEYFELALQSGAWGYVSKSTSTQDLLNALRRVARGEVVIHDGVGSAR
jgi:two-component system response regulator DesR